MLRAIQRLKEGTRAAVAPTVALSLFALIGMGGIAFDYAHLADLDTELQNAADQAALAAATQLDGSDGSRTRAAAAAQSLLNNTTFFASDGAMDAAGRKVTIATVNFYQSYDDATESYGDPASTDENARVVQVNVAGRRADYALTPVVGAVTSGTIDAEAAASLASAVCNVPPLMMCVPNPAEEFPTDADVGKGVLLQPGPNVGFWAPGDYGYLDFGDGASGLQINLGRNNETAGCTDMSNGIPTEPGNKASVTDSLNSRFDLYPVASSSCDAATGDFCPAENTHKDLAKTYEIVVNNWDAPPAPPPPNPVTTEVVECGDPGQTLVGESNQTDTSGFSLPSASGMPPPGLPRDTVHWACSECSKFGDGVWARDAYLGTAHGTDAATVAAALDKAAGSLTRWDVYQWELANRATRLAKKSIEVSVSFDEQGNSGKGKYTFTNRCVFPQPVNGTGIPANTSQKDRRMLTIAAVDCGGLNGKSNVIVEKWVDVFLVEPSLTRTTPTSPYATGKEQIYVEIVRAAQRPNGQSAFQYYLRQKPRLLR
jgi:Flp pilus assembly protein TadG